MTVLMVVMVKHSFSNLVYLGALSLLVFVFTLLILVAAVTLFIPNTFGFAFGVSMRSFTIAAVILLTAVAAAVSFLLVLFNAGMRRK